MPADAPAFQMPVDGGAHFHKTDFQVYTPRDGNWRGEFAGVTSVEQRRAFSDALIRDARDKQLDAIAITDHHDICIFPHVREAANNEALSGGMQPIAVFPGVELTLSNPPCQALLLFDPDLSEDALRHIWGALGITPLSDSEPSCGDPQALRSDLDLNRIYSVLDGLIVNPSESEIARRMTLEGHFILLPHVRKNGHKTLLRHGQNKGFSEMQCVGGYIEGCYYTELGQGNRDILEGRSLEWGGKAVGVFQTSDSRSAVIEHQRVRFPTLGRWPTWVKWAIPSAEALRQACLARDSRINHSEPTLPNLRLRGVEVSDSSFLGPCKLGINPQLTSFIGGRGTGKSSLLEYIRWGLCDDPSAAREGGGGDELPDYQKRRKSLIEKTLRSCRGTITVYYEKFGVVFRLQRDSSDTVERVRVTTTTGDSYELPGVQVRQQFPVIAYAQKQLSVVGTLPDEVRRLVTDPLRERLATIDREITESALPVLKSARQRWLRLNQLDSHIAEAKQQLESTKLQIEALRGGLGSMSPEDADVVSSHDAYLAQKAWIQSIDSSIAATRAAVSQAMQVADTRLRSHAVSDSWPHNEQLSRIAGAVDGLRSSVLHQLGSLVEELANFRLNSDAVSTAATEILAACATHEEAYAQSIARVAENERQLSDLRKLESDAAEIQRRITGFSDEVQVLSATATEDGVDPFARWKQLHAERTAVLSQQATALTERAAHAFHVVVRPFADQTSSRAKLQLLLSCGRNIRAADEKIRALIETVSAAHDPLSEWVAVVDEFRTLAESKGSASTPHTPRLETAGFSTANVASLRDGLDLQLLEDVRYVPLLDEIVFQFTFGRHPDGREAYIPFQDASPGQQATVLLKALLAQDGPPLLIDQPEEDLDNEQVNIIADHIRFTKHHRQLIFVSHNANLVVNGDSELVVCFGYRRPDDQTAATVVREGSIDCGPVRELITTVMEGGRAAFDLRRQKYNF